MNLTFREGTDILPQVRGFARVNSAHPLRTPFAPYKEPQIHSHSGNSKSRGGSSTETAGKNYSKGAGGMT